MVDNIFGENILVTGGTGFLGRHVVGELLSLGVTPTVLTRSAQTDVFGKTKTKPNIVEFDLFDYSGLNVLFEKIRPDRIIHLAGYTHRTDECPDILGKFNYEATAKLLEAAETVKIKRIIIIGTADEYGFQNCPQVETMPAMPVSEYAVSKNKAVNYALSLHHKENLPVVVARPFTIYGFNQPAKMFVAQAVECAVRKIPFAMSNGLQKRDLLFVTDFVNAIIKLLTIEGVEGEVFNVGSGRSIALRDLAKKIWKIAGADEKLLRIGARQAGQNELHDTHSDNTKIRSWLNWEPQISLDEGLKLVVGQVTKDLK